MSEESKKKQGEEESASKEADNYFFGGITEYRLEDIEAEVLNDNVYLDVFAGSDVRFKEEIKNFSGALDIISDLSVHKYHYNTKDFSDKNFPEGEQVGIMAQNLEKHLPQIVKEDEAGFKFVNYAGLSPLLVSATQELLTITKKQSALIAELNSEVKELKSRLDSINSNLS